MTPVRDDGRLEQRLTKNAAKRRRLYGNRRRVWRSVKIIHDFRTDPKRFSKRFSATKRARVRERARDDANSAGFRDARNPEPTRLLDTGPVFFTTIPTLAIMSLLVLLSVLLRRRWHAIAVSGLVLTLIFLGASENLRADLPAALLLGALMVFVAARFGILSLYATFLVVGLIVRFPLTLDFSRWYAGRSLFVLLIIVGLAFGGFWIALGGKSPFGTVALEE